MDLNDIPPYLATAFVIGAGCQLVFNATQAEQGPSSVARHLLVRFAGICLIAATAAFWLIHLLPAHSSALPVAPDRVLIGTVPAGPAPLPIGEGPK